MRLRRSAALVLVLLVSMAASPAAADTEPWAWPVGRTGIGERFDPPATDFGVGHRGLDIEAPAGTSVRSVAPGTVVFVGRVADVDVVTIDHGGERSTYQPVRGSVRRGDAVTRGQAIGTLLPAPSHCAGSCLHLGRLADPDTAPGERRQYLDPLDLLGGGRFRLITPHGDPPAPPLLGGGELRRPVAGPVSSAYGMRVHPVTGVRKLHDGTDFAARCGTAVHAAAGGTVTGTPTDRAYGKRVIVDHRGGLRTAYAHLSSRSVSRGDRVGAGTVIGRVGSTGLSTGCHLHFMVLKGNRPTNPSPYL